MFFELLHVYDRGYSLIVIPCTVQKHPSSVRLLPPPSPPPSSQQSSCNYQRSSNGAQMSGTVSVKSGSESNLQAAVANVGPVAVAVDGANNAFRVSQEGLYGGVFNAIPEFLIRVP